ncbi:MAG: hypothetical protein L7T24_03220 [Luminiphilus sp.]|nr:hypothetical protein [Luminiphilus sp.]
MQRITTIITALLMTGLLSGCITVYEGPGKTVDTSTQAQDTGSSAGKAAETCQCDHDH